ncbi:phage major tail tube protein [Wolbachia endosymbiont of Cylisticus convexus]|nr:phage major tail tube protein [Wolbachia endosymbiont of Cylisticus convexus]
MDGTIEHFFWVLVRMPSAAKYAMQVEKEQKWLPRLAPLLPLSIPEPLAMDFLAIDGSSVSLTLRGELQGSGNNDIEGVIINLRGIFKEFDFGSWKPAEKATLKCTVAAHYYKLTIGGNELIEIDAENMIRKINGVDQMALLQAILGI